MECSSINQSSYIDTNSNTKKYHTHQIPLWMLTGPFSLENNIKLKFSLEFPFYFKNQKIY